jgi:formate/nitrite transporter FocA (FNT family)
LGIGIANGLHWCTGTAVYSFILIILTLITVPNTIGHVFLLYIFNSTVIYYKSTQSLQSSTEDIISSKNDETDDKIEIN